MSTFDWIIITILIVFIFHGLRQGFILAVGGLLSYVIGIYAAVRYFVVVAEMLGGASWALPVAFFVIFVLVSYGVGFVFWIMNKIFHIVSLIPFAKAVNRLLGALLGFVQGVFAVSMGLYVLDRYFFFIDVENIFGGSAVANAFTAVGRTLSPLMPSLLEQIEIFLT